MARKFLYLVALIVVLVIAGLVALRIWSKELTEFTLTPRVEFVEQQAFAPNAYQDPGMWFSRPGIGTDDPARWHPGLQGSERSLLPGPAEPSEDPAPAFAVFFVHPTTYFERKRWNAPLDDAESQELARTFLRGMASPFGEATEIWAPRYRQMTFGAFLTDGEEREKALAAAYRDVEQAFEFFLSSVDDGTPIVLAGHSQGALHLIHLIADRVAGTPLSKRIAAAYLVGWPISLEHDLPELGLAACATPDQGNCISSWMSFSEPAQPGQVLQTFRDSEGLDGLTRGDGPILCTNPLTGKYGGEAPATANLGTLFPNGELTGGVLKPGMVPARCDDYGLLLIGEGPDLGPYVLPGNNYHVYDIPLFWANLQADVRRRVEAWKPAS